MHLDSRISFTGAPSYELMNEKGIMKQVCNFECSYMGSLDILDNIKEYNIIRKGDTLYDKMMHNLGNGDYSHDRKEYLEYLKFLNLKKWDERKYVDLTKKKVYAWLLAAYRHNDEIAIFMRTEKSIEKDNVSYFVAIRDAFLESEEKLRNECKMILRDWEIVK